jgi:hypothetical protein
MAIRINKVLDLTAVNQFNTHCYGNDDDIVRYQQAKYRTLPSNEGTFEARIAPVQLNEGEYLLSIGLLPNLHDQWCFYEYHHHAYSFKVTNSGWSYNGVFTPIVEWNHQGQTKSAQAA